MNVSLRLEGVAFTASLRSRHETAGGVELSGATVDSATVAFQLEFADLHGDPLSRTNPLRAAFTRHVAADTTGTADLPRPMDDAGNGPSGGLLVPDSAAGDHLAAALDITLPHGLVVEAFGGDEADDDDAAGRSASASGMLRSASRGVSAAAGSGCNDRPASSRGGKIIVTFPDVELPNHGNLRLDDRTAEAARRHRKLFGEGGTQQDGEAMHRQQSADDDQQSASDASSASAFDPRDFVRGSTMVVADPAAPGIAGPMRLTLDPFGAELEGEQSADRATGFSVQGSLVKTVAHHLTLAAAREAWPGEPALASSVSESGDAESEDGRHVAVDVTYTATVSATLHAATADAVVELCYTRWLPQLAHEALASDNRLATMKRRLETALDVARHLQAFVARAAVAHRRADRVRIRILRAEKLRDTDTIGSADPYVRVCVAAGAAVDPHARKDGAHWQRTPVSSINNDDDGAAQWTSDNDFIFSLKDDALHSSDSSGEESGAVVHVQVLDEDFFADDPMGRGRVTVASLAKALAETAHGAACVRVPLANADGSEDRGVVLLDAVCAPLSEPAAAAEAEEERAKSPAASATTTAGYESDFDADDEHKEEDEAAAEAANDDDEPDAAPVEEEHEAAPETDDDTNDAKEQPEGEEEEEEAAVFMTEEEREGVISIVQAELRAGVSQRLAVYHRHHAAEANREEQREKEDAQASAQLQAESSATHNNTNPDDRALVPMQQADVGDDETTRGAAYGPGCHHTVRTLSQLTAAGPQRRQPRKPVPPPLRGVPTEPPTTQRAKRRGGPPASEQEKTRRYTTSLLTPFRIPVQTCGGSAEWRNGSLFGTSAQTRWLPAITTGAPEVDAEADESLRRALTTRPSTTTPRRQQSAAHHAACSPAEVRAAREQAVAPPAWSDRRQQPRPAPPAASRGSARRRHDGGPHGGRGGGPEDWRRSPAVNDGDDGAPKPQRRHGSARPTRAAAADGDDTAAAPPSDRGSSAATGRPPRGYRGSAGQLPAAYTENLMRLAAPPLARGGSRQSATPIGKASGDDAAADPDLETSPHQSPAGAEGRDEPTSQHSSPAAALEQDDGSSPRRHSSNGDGAKRPGCRKGDPTIAAGARLYRAPMADPVGERKRLTAELRELRTAARA